MCVYQIDASTERRFTGNPASVVANAEGLSAGQMQAIARELNNSDGRTDATYH
ncbi:MAG: PhzF family phenazine biosynthesis protein [Rhodanobacteraceae bacterium]|nr:PhzF family phenazine biosynthesis protein [Rhodanobacteraceae bacterium]